VFALLGMRALYFLLAGAATRFRYLRPGLAVILAAVAVKLLLADLYHVPTWASPAFIAAVLAVVTALSIHHNAKERTRHVQRQLHGEPDHRRVEHRSPVR
jgi:tellurite resistance protein TerC